MVFFQTVIFSCVILLAACSAAGPFPGGPQPEHANEIVGPEPFREESGNIVKRDVTGSSTGKPDDMAKEQTKEGPGVSAQQATDTQKQPDKASGGPSMATGGSDGGGKSTPKAPSDVPNGAI